MSWDRAQEAWRDFLLDVRRVRTHLHCSFGGATFRGHSNSLKNLEADRSKYRLRPTLFRRPFRVDPDFKDELSKMDASSTRLEHVFSDRQRVLKYPRQEQRRRLSAALDDPCGPESAHDALSRIDNEIRMFKPTQGWIEAPEEAVLAGPPGKHNTLIETASGQGGRLVILGRACRDATSWRSNSTLGLVGGPRRRAVLRLAPTSASWRRYGPFQQQSHGQARIPPAGLRQREAVHLGS